MAGPSPIAPVVESYDLTRFKSRELVGQIAQKGTALIEKEVELARTELKADLQSELAMAAGIGVAAACAIITITLLCVAGIFALHSAGILQGWLGALSFASGSLLIGITAGLWGWAKRVKQPLQATRRTLKEHLQWAKNQLA